MATADTANARLSSPLRAPHANVGGATPRRLTLLLLLGLLLIAAQLLWLLRPLWLAHPGVRQVLTPVTAALGFDLERPLLRDIWQTRQVDLVADAANPGAWEVRATLMHSARILQPWPTLQLSLQDDAGNVVGQRQLTPAEYLATGRTSPLLEGDQPVQIRVGVHQRATSDGSLPVFASAKLIPLP